MYTQVCRKGGRQEGICPNWLSGSGNLLKTATIEALARFKAPLVKDLYGEIKFWWISICLIKAVIILVLKLDSLSDKKV